MPPRPVRTGPLAAVAAAALVLAGRPALAVDWSKVDVETVRALTRQGPLVAVQETPSGRLQLATAAMAIGASPERVSDAMLDFAHYPEFMPQVEKAEVVSRTATSAEVRFTLKFEVSVITRRVRYLIRYDLKEPGQAAYRLVEGDLSRNEGGWTVRSVDGGRQSVLFYSNFTDLGRMGPIVGALLKQPSMEMAIAASGVAVLVKHVKKRAEDLGW